MEARSTWTSAETVKGGDWTHRFYGVGTIANGRFLSNLGSRGDLREQCRGTKDANRLNRNRGQRN